MTSITGANSTFTLSISSLFTIPQQLQGYATDDSFATEPLQSAEVMMGVDGLLSGGFVYVEVKQSITLQADSPSAPIFDQWYYAQQQIQDVYVASGIITLPSVGLKYTMTKGFLTSYPPLPDVKKLLQPRKFGITWQSAQVQNIATN
jgi:hypothetical protein